jgi:UDP-N-acetylglucosamine acyltransferase
MIHSTAIVDAEAQVAADAEIGPYCVIGRDVVIGSGTVLMSHITMAGPATIGQANRFYPYCSIANAARISSIPASRLSLRSAIATAFAESAQLIAARAGDKDDWQPWQLFSRSHIAHDCMVGITSSSQTTAPWPDVLVEDHAVMED